MMVSKRLIAPLRNTFMLFGATLLTSCAIADKSSVGSADMEPQRLTHERSQAIDEAVEDLIAGGQIPGAVVMLAERGEVVHFNAGGLSDIENRIPIARDTIFRFYSMTKPLTCATVMTLYDDGQIDLDDPIKDYLPELAEMRVRTADGDVPATKDITIRNLMTHTSGFSYAILPGVAQQDYSDADVFAIRNRLSESLEDHVKRLAQMPLVAEPGTVWNYGESMGVLGRLVEVVSGQAFGEYMKAHVLTPLGMNDTDFYVPADKSGRLAELYLMSHDGVMTNAEDDIQYGGSYLEEPKLEYGGAGLVGTASDYMIFAQMLLNGGQSGGKKILTEDSVQMMTSNQLDESLGEAPLAASGRGPEAGFGLCGLVIKDVSEGGPPGAVGEYGWGGWASTNFWVDPKHQIAGLIFTQVIPEDIGSVELGSKVRGVVYATENKE